MSMCVKTLSKSCWPLLDFWKMIDHCYNFKRNDKTYLKSSARMVFQKHNVDEIQYDNSIFCNKLFLLHSWNEIIHWELICKVFKEKISQLFKICLEILFLYYGKLMIEIYLFQKSLKKCWIFLLSISNIVSLNILWKNVFVSIIRNE